MRISYLRLLPLLPALSFFITHNQNIFSSPPDPFVVITVQSNLRECVRVFVHREDVVDRPTESILRRLRGGVCIRVKDYA